MAETSASGPKQARETVGSLELFSTLTTFRPIFSVLLAQNDSTRSNSDKRSTTDFGVLRH
jgi:hypothetical protein